MDRSSRRAGLVAPLLRVVAARCRVSLGVAKTHGLYRVGLGLTDLTGVFHPDDGYLPGQELGAGGGPLTVPYQGRTPGGIMARLAGPGMAGAKVDFGRNAAYWFRASPTGMD